MGKRPLLVATILVLGFIFAFIVFKALLSSFQGTTTTATTSDGSSTTSAQKIYFQSGTITEERIPFQTVADPAYPGLSIYWVKESVVNGNDTCTLYDNETKQIYANRYRNDGQLGGAKTGWMYYDNKSITKDNATKFLDKVCFKS